MLRVHADAPGAAAAAPGVHATIVRDFQDPYLELVRLLGEAAEIEHALLLQYLYAATSVKDEYASLRGAGFAVSSNVLGVAIQEMQHLEHVNRMLVALGAAPTLERQGFPYEPDIYPFPLNLESLSSTTLAKYVFTESPAGALDPADPANADPANADLIARVTAALHGARPNHLGSLYGTIISLTHDVIAMSLPDVEDLTGYVPQLEAIRSQGETDHFEFFRDVFLGTHPALVGVPGVWDLAPTDARFPARQLPLNPSAFVGHPDAIADPGLQRLAWLSDLEYWLLLTLLDLSYRFSNAGASARAKSHMTANLWPLALHLASRGAAAPFDPLSMGYSPGSNLAGTVRVLRQLALEAKAVATAAAGDLPSGYVRDNIDRTLTYLAGLTTTTGPVPTPADGAAAPVVPAAQQAQDFWFEFDDRFAFHPTPEIQQAYGQIGGLDDIKNHFIASFQSGHHPADFRAAVEPARAGLEVLAREQASIIDGHFHGDQDALRLAFEHFGTGDLLDERRPPGNKVHMMDSGGPDNPPVGYHRWYPIIRANIELGIDADRWRSIANLVALAWAIHGEVQPIQDRVNAALPAARLDALRRYWLPRSEGDLDHDVATYDPFPPPAT